MTRSNFSFSPTEAFLQAQVQELQAQLEEARQTLDAIQHGEVDALVVQAPEGDQIFTLKGADESYRLLVQQMQEGAVTIGADGTILFSNRHFAQMVQEPLERVIGSSIGRFADGADRATLETLLQAGRQAPQRGELRLTTSDGQALPVYLAVSPFRAEGVQSLCLVVTDLTQQKRNAEIVANEKLARSILEHAAEAMAVCDSQGRVQRANPAACRLCACDPRGQAFDAVFPLRASADATAMPPGAEGPKSSLGFLTPALRGQSIWGLEVELNRFREPTSFLLLSASPLLGEDGTSLGCVVSLTDISQRKEAERQLKAMNVSLEERVARRTAELELHRRQLRSLALELTRAEQRERRRIATEMHDHLGQLLVAARMRVGALAAVNTQQRQARQVAEDILAQAIDYSRSLIAELSPSILFELGLEPALEWLAEHMQQQHGLTVQVDSDGPTDTLSEDARTLLFQATRELLFNVVKHANTDRARLTVRHTDDAIRISVCDQGTGFSDPAPRQSGKGQRSGFGLFSIRERLILIGGKLEVQSTSGCGAEVTMVVPLEGLP